MSYRKLKADHLFTGSQLLSNGEILIIEPGGKVVSVVNGKDAGGDGIETFEGILTPGFINAHCHLELSHMKGLIPERTGLVDFVYKVVTERHFEEDDIIDAIAKTEEQMVQDGIVAVGDICNNILTLRQKLEHKLMYYNFIETSGWAPFVAAARWQLSKKIYDEFTQQHLEASVVPHAPYSVSNDLWQNMMPLFAGKTITIHNQETILENEFFLTGTGDLLKMYERMGIDNSFFLPGNKTSLQTIFHKLSEAFSVVLVHNTFISQADINYVKENTGARQLISFCLCPNANLFIENTLPPVEMLVKNDCTIILGTDSLASNKSLNILEEIKTLHRHFPFLTLEKTLQWATLNGARALQMDEALGSFERGKMPGVALITHVDKTTLTNESAVTRVL